MWHIGPYTLVGHGPIIDIAASKIICERKVGEKQPHCNEIVHFNSNEFKDGEPKTLETLNKITKLVNSELSPLIPAKKKIGMGVDTILAAPAIGFVDASVPGVPGHSLHDNELKEILKPIHPASIKSSLAVEQKNKNKQKCKSNCGCKKQEQSDNNSDTTDDDDNNDEQLESDDSEKESDMETDDDDDDCLQVDDVSEHLVPVNEFQNGIDDMYHMIKVTGEDLVAVKCNRLKKLLAEVRADLVGSDYENVVKGLTILVNKECSGISFGEEEVRNQLRMLESSPLKKSLLAEISLLTNEIEDELYRVRDIFTRLSNIDDYKNLPTMLNRLEQEKLIDANLSEKLASLSNISYTELRKLLVAAKPELLAQQIHYGDDDDDDKETYWKNGR